MNLLKIVSGAVPKWRNLSSVPLTLWGHVSGWHPKKQHLLRSIVRKRQLGETKKWSVAKGGGEIKAGLIGHKSERDLKCKPVMCLAP